MQRLGRIGCVSHRRGQSTGEISLLLVQGTFHITVIRESTPSIQLLTLESAWIISVPYLCGQSTIYILYTLYIYTLLNMPVYIGKVSKQIFMESRVGILNYILSIHPSTYLQISGSKTSCGCQHFSLSNWLCLAGPMLGLPGCS